MELFNVYLIQIRIEMNTHFLGKQFSEVRELL